MLFLKSHMQIEFDYTNWKGKTSKRKAIVQRFAFGKTEWHQEEQFLMMGFDLDKKETRYFAMDDMRNIQKISNN